MLGIILTGGWAWTCTIVPLEVARLVVLDRACDLAVNPDLPDFPLATDERMVLNARSSYSVSAMPPATARTYSISSSRSSSESEDQGRGYI